MNLKVIGIVLCLVLSGCTFSVPQAESALRWAKSLTQEEAVSTDQQPLWLASVGESGSLVKPYTVADFTVFANSDGDAIAFDGWIIRSVTGFGLKAPLSISGKEGERSFVSGQSVVVARCGSWIWRQPVWRQRCDQGASEIVLDEAGNIQKISMSLGEKVGFVTLRVAN
ncbi:hypothetical protein N9V97_06880 [Luminiphilus sp.]|nr:hypothetical protein [Luminiphilus sp.]